MKIELNGQLACPHCHAFDDQALDRSKCRSCQRVFTADDVKKAEYDALSAEEKAARVQAALAAAPKPGDVRYMVLSQRDEFFRSRFDPEILAQRLNELAAAGWRVISVTATDVGSFFGSFMPKAGGASRQELLVVLTKTF